MLYTSGEHPYPEVRGVPQRVVLMNSRPEVGLESGLRGLPISLPEIAGFCAGSVASGVPCGGCAEDDPTELALSWARKLKAPWPSGWYMSWASDKQNVVNLGNICSRGGVEKRRMVREGKRSEGKIKEDRIEQKGKKGKTGAEKSRDKGRW